MIGNIVTILYKFYDEYKQTTPKKLKLIDAYLFCVMLTGIIQFAYCALVGTFPFNSFLSGFISTVGCFVLGGIQLELSHLLFHQPNFHLIFSFLFKVSYRLQVNRENQDIFKNVSAERAFADFIFAHVILHLVVVNFLG